jgi:predicted RNA methylase
MIIDSIASAACAVRRISRRRNAQATWAPADFPYPCLVDTRRTEAFGSAIRATVRAGDVVVDAGSGSGILAFFAASAGAACVYAVEIDPVLASWLERSVRANGLADTVHVICGDIGTVRLPTAVDVCICEMLDTGLLDETQVLALNRVSAWRRTNPVISKTWTWATSAGSSTRRTIWIT